MAESPITITGPGFPTLLTTLFVALKLTGVISWSWVWVLSPIWITFGLTVLFIIIGLIAAAIMGIL